MAALEPDSGAGWSHRYRLEDRYRATAGTVFMTGIQALCRIPIDQMRLDRAAGLNTAAYCSGYPGSPVAGLADEFPRAVAATPEFPIHHLQAVNEEFGVTAVMGTQLASTRPDCHYDGIAGIWYGKAPGLDRATDALRHAVFTGSSAGGGALAIVGDDPSAKSSTMPSSSDAALADLHMPVLYPANPAECLELGLHGIAMSRATGLWSALKVVTAVADGNGSAHVPVLSSVPVMPIHRTADGDVWRPHPSAQLLGPRMVEVEREFHEVRTELARRYGAENHLNQMVTDPPHAWLGIVATGFTFGELREAFRRLGFNRRAEVSAAGIRLLNLRMPLPFDRELIRRFAGGLQRILVVEEKNPTLEQLVRDALYAHRERPEVFGKFTDSGDRILPSHGQLDADVIAPALRHQLEPRMGERLRPAPPPPRERIPLAQPRTPYFCSGCPHSWGMKVEEGTAVGMGTGCHGMGLLLDSERVGDSLGIGAMGNEGVMWFGMAPFVRTRHMVQNIGDGTYFHSGQLAIQAAVGAGVTMTFKLLYNHTVAMTGGQDAGHQIPPQQLAAVLLAHGVKSVAITTDDPDGYERTGLPASVSVHDRREVVEVQKQLAELDGVTVLIHDQGCAAELRRDRKRGDVATPKRRVYINHRICEGCGDCGDVSGCLSVQPLDTVLGRKTTIDQASCNYDYSCLNGDCPAFVTVDADDLAAASARTGSRSGTGVAGRPDPAAIAVDEPEPAALDGQFTIRMAGIGGTGVVTVAQVMGMAAMIAGLEVAGLDQTGLSQKAGPVISDVVIGPAGREPRSNLAGRGRADVVLAFDRLVAASDGALTAVGRHTEILAGATMTPTGRQVVNPALSTDDEGAINARFASATDRSVAVYRVAEVAERLVGVAATANMCLLGVAAQRGLLPVPLDALRQAIELNGVAVSGNLAALEWGRRYASDPSAVELWLEQTVAPEHDPTRIPAFSLPSSLARRVAAVVHQADLGSSGSDELGFLVADLVDYQNKAWARRFLNLVERSAALGDPILTMATARGFHKLMAYKDEYEVARLALMDDALATPAGTPLKWQLHPPILAALGLDRKIGVPDDTRPLFVALAQGKRLRGTRLDPFGRTELRRQERALIDEHETTMTVVVDALVAADGGDDHERAAAVELARAPLDIRGYESLKLKRIADYRRKVVRLLHPTGIGPDR